MYDSLLILLQTSGFLSIILQRILCFSDGNMRHLIVEACITRNLIDASAYFWPCYVSAAAVGPSDASTAQKSAWSTFMEWAPLSGSLINSLVATPASRYC